ncbi:partitioning defective 3 homolog [Aplysia californica]|uniref:Partitioning defective 3 homolog n=1 Tax=Aplysia californica TaxID=6500 RepID=A0ABM0ZZ86_APLCA|nr:partitioning defective 3 homolog [Aplysia californica]
MPMKVIVCFDNVRVTVPCGEGDIPVRELISKAVHRYKRATGKGANHWVEVTNLKTICYGGILDPDDQLSDVVDDREQLIAVFEEQDRASIQHNGGDGASASSTGTVSPDIFHGLGEDGGPVRADGVHPAAAALAVFPPPRHNSSSSNNASTDVVVTPRDLSIGSNLRVRRGSEPSLNLLTDELPSEINPTPLSVLRPSIPRRESVRDSDEPRSESSDEDKRVKVTMHGSLDRKKLGPSRFARDAFRTSLSNRPEMFRWLEAQERQEQRTKEAQAQERTGPVDGHDGEDVNISTQPNPTLITLQNDGGPLGIHAIPASDENGKDIGLLIQSIEPERPVHRDGRIQPEDTIVEINGTSLKDVPFLRAQEIFRAAMDTKEIRLQVLKADTAIPETSSTLLPPSPKQRRAPQGPPVLPKPRSHAPMKPSPLTLPSQESEKDVKSSSPVPAPREHSKKAVPSNSSDNGQRTESFRTSDKLSSFSSNSSSSTNSGQKLESLSKPIPKRTSSASNNNVIKPGPPIKPPKKTPPAVPVRSPNTGLTPGPPTDLPLNTAYNTRKIGKKLGIQLKKGPLGLGFSVTSRDNQTDGNTPIYIRNILPKGAAVQDGQLKPGDRLLEVNGVEMTGKTQAEAVSFLRMLPEGSMVNLLVSRQEEVEEKFKVPRKMSDSSEPLATALTGLESGPEDTATAMAEGHVGAEADLPAVSLSQPSRGTEAMEDSPPGQVKEKITFHVQLNDTGSAGLGVSVKGKTEPTDQGLRDLGIFVNSVLQGGAASKDGRLEVNDQLLEVNGVRLEGLSNTAAMEALRMAMMDEGLIPGHSTVTVARRAEPNSMPFFCGDTADSSQADAMLPPPSVHQRSVSASSDLPAPIVHQRSSSASETFSSPVVQRFGSDKDMPSPIPPVRSKRVAALRERFSEMGNGLRNESYMKATNESMDVGPAGLRNESYMKATHDTLNESEAFKNLLPSPSKPVAPLKHSQSQEGKENIVIVENDTYTLPQKPQRPHSTIGFLHGGPHGSVSDDEAFRRESVASSKDESDLSPSGDLILPFAREGFGRQSMSEKRKGHLDPRSTEIYKLVKANKESKGGFLGRRVRSFHVTGATNVDVVPAVRGVPTAQNTPLSPRKGSNPAPTEAPPVSNSMMHVPDDSTYNPNRTARDSSPSNLKRSSSVEDLSHPVASQAPVSSVSSSTSVQQSRDNSPMWRTNRFGRARACNESFRAAVDRSYDALDPALMDTLEEESAESGAFTLEPSNSGRSSISSENTSEDTNSLKRRKAKEKDKKAGGLLKGFLRFGKGRKSNEEAMRRSRSEERSGDRVIDRRTDLSLERPVEKKDRWAAQPYGDAQNLGFVPLTVPQGHQQMGRRASNQEEERIEEEYARLREFHVSNQRLRSQSVDPTLGRNKLGSSSSSTERSSPFQPYHGSSQQQQILQHQLQQFQLQQQQQQQLNADPRTFHPAAVSQGQPLTGQDHRGGRQYMSSSQSSLDPGGRPNIAKAVMSRAEYIQQLRSLYQQRHRQRQGVYPLDDSEEFYEMQIQELEQRQWTPTSSDNSYDGRSSREPVRFTDRPPSRLPEDSPERPYGSTSSMVNASSSSLPHTHQHHQQQRYHQHLYNTAPHPGSRPSPRGPPSSAHDMATYYKQQQQRDQHIQHLQQHHHHHHHNPPSPHGGLRDDYELPSGHEHYNSNMNYPIPDSRSQQPFYTGPPQAYHHTAPHPYNHHYRGNHPHTDSSSAKV